MCVSSGIHLFMTYQSPLGIASKLSSTLLSARPPPRISDFPCCSFLFILYCIYSLLKPFRHSPGPSGQKPAVWVAYAAMTSIPGLGLSQPEVWAPFRRRAVPGCVQGSALWSLTPGCRRPSSPCVFPSSLLSLRGHMSHWVRAHPNEPILTSLSL